MRIVSWNILQGGGRRLEGILEAIGRWAPDVITLQEVRARHLEQITQHLSKIGLGFHYLSDHATDTENCILIAARDPLEAGDFIQEREGQCHILEANVADLTVLPLHFPQKAAQVPLFEAVLQDTASLLDLPAILIGDLNCGIPFEDSTAKTFANTKYFQALKEAGWVDAFRQHQGCDAREFSWVSPRTGREFRYDHVLIGPALVPRLNSVTYDHEVRETGLSDHSALIVDFHRLAEIQRSRPRQSR